MGHATLAAKACNQVNPGLKQASRFPPRRRQRGLVPTPCARAHGEVPSSKTLVVPVWHTKAGSRRRRWPKRHYRNHAGGCEEMAVPRRDLIGTTLALLVVGLLIVCCLWIIRPFLPATVWAVTIVVATWRLLLRAQAALWHSRT